MSCFVSSVVSRALSYSRPLGLAAYRRAPGHIGQWSARSVGRSRVFMCTEANDTMVDTVRMKLTEELKPLQLEVIPTYGDPNGSHVSIQVVSEAFAGKSVVARHQMVYKVIWEEMQGAIHAVDSMVTKTPQEAGL